MVFFSSSLLYTHKIRVDVDSTKDERRKKEAEEEEATTTTTAKPFEGLSEEEQRSLQVPWHIFCACLDDIAQVGERGKEERKHRKEVFFFQQQQQQKNKRLRSDQ